MEYRTYLLFLLAAIAVGAFLACATKHALDPLLIALLAVFLGILTLLTWLFLRPVCWLFFVATAAVVAVYVADLAFLAA